jgi:O-antigen/teichoic acid export membrane protein
MAARLDLASSPELRRPRRLAAGILAGLRQRAGGRALLQRSGIIFSINIAGLAMAAAAQLLLARTVGAVEFGYYAYAFAWLSLTSLLATAGFQASVVRFGAVYVSQGRHDLMRRFARFALLMGLASGGLLLAVGWALLRGLDDRLEEGLAATLLVGLVATPVIALTRISGSCLRAHGRHIAAVFSEVCLREMAVLMFIALSLLALPGEASAAQVMMAVLLVSCAGLGWLQLQLRGLRPPADGPPVAEAAPLPVREWLTSSGYLLLFASANLLQKRVDVLLAGLLFGTTSAGAYSVAIYLAGLAMLPQTAIGFVAAPEIARLYAQGATEQLHRTVRTTAAGSFAAALAIGAAVWVAAPLLPVMVGAEFEQAVWPARLLVLGHLLSASFGCIEVVMTMTGDERRAANLLVKLTVINIPLLWVWMNLFGLIGAALGTVSIVLLFKIYCCIVVYRRHGMLCTVFVSGKSSIVPIEDSRR